MLPIRELFLLTLEREPCNTMHVISRKLLKDFWEAHPDAETPLRAWFKEAEDATWKSSAELKSKFGSASIIDEKRVVFNIGGNKYRLVTWVHYRHGRVMTRWIGTHKEYDKLDVGAV